MHGIFRTFWTRNMYDFVSNNGNYGRSKSLILTVFRKWFFIHFPLLDNYTILLSLLERNFEKLSKTQKGHIFTEKSLIKNLGQLANKRHFKKTTLFSMLGIFTKLFKVQVCPDQPRNLFFISFLRYKFSKFPPKKAWNLP